MGENSKGEFVTPEDVAAGSKESADVKIARLRRERGDAQREAADLREKVARLENLLHDTEVERIRAANEVRRLRTAAG